MLQITRNAAKNNAAFFRFILFAETFFVICCVSFIFAQLKKKRKKMAAAVITLNTKLFFRPDFLTFYRNLLFKHHSELFDGFI